MEKDYLVKIICVVYKLTESFSEKEPLKFFIRGRAIAIFTDIIKQEKASKILKNIELIESYLEIAQKQNLLEKDHSDVLMKEYQRIAEQIQDNSKNLNNSQKKVKNEPVKTQNSGKKPVKERHQKILEFLEKNQTGQIRDFKEIMPEITKRTLRRDTDELLSRNLIQRIGDGPNTIYKLRNNILGHP